MAARKKADSRPKVRVECKDGTAASVKITAGGTDLTALLPINRAVLMIEAGDATMATLHLEVHVDQIDASVLPEGVTIATRSASQVRYEKPSEPEEGWPEPEAS